MKLGLRRLGNLAQIVGEDVSWAAQHLWLNEIGGSPLTPRPLRLLVYRLGRVRTKTLDIYSRCTIVGTGPLTIGKNSFVNGGCYFEAVGPISIGAETAIGMEAMFVTSSHPLDENGRFSTRAVPRPVVVGDGCWIGARALILPGVTIGDGVIVAAGAVVAKDCEPRGLYGGVPARRIKDLDPRPAASSGLPTAPA